MQEVLPVIAEMFKHALATKNLKIVFGTDAVAGAHGRNAEEFIYRVQAGEDPMQAMVDANARAAESLNMQGEIGLCTAEGNVVPVHVSLTRIVDDARESMSLPEDFAEHFEE